MKVFDILLEDYDLLFTKGDFKIGESTTQHIGLLLLTEKGEWRYKFTVGVGIRSALNEDGNLLALQGEIQEQLEADGMNIKELRLKGDVYVNAEYK
ncbi:MAG: hypothetical protein Fur0027_19710 [Raineya sp.]